MKKICALFCLILFSSWSVAQTAQPSFAASFPNLLNLQFPANNSSIPNLNLYYPQNANLAVDVNSVQLEPNSQTIMTIVQMAGQGVKQTSNQVNYTVQAASVPNSAQARWTVNYSTSNISYALETIAHTLIVPANGNVYSIESVLLAGIALDVSSLDIQHKYSLQGAVFVETPQPLYYIGKPATTTDFINLQSQPEGGEKVAGIAAQSPVTILALSVTETGAHLLLATPFGLSGWAPVNLQLAEGGLERLQQATLNIPASQAIASITQLLPASTPEVKAKVNVAVNAAGNSATSAIDPVNINQVNLSQAENLTSNLSEDINLFAEAVSDSSRWLGVLEPNQKISKLILNNPETNIDLRFDVPIFLYVDSYQDYAVFDEMYQLNEDDIVGYVRYVFKNGDTCVNSLHYFQHDDDTMRVKQELISGTECHEGMLELNIRPKRMLWRAYQPNGQVAGETVLASAPVLDPNHSVARYWNDALLTAIRQDFARPTVHARNLFHSSLAMYDAWAVFDPVAEPYLLGHTVDGYQCDFSGYTLPAGADLAELREQAISYAAYRLLQHRFSGRATTDANREYSPFKGYFQALGYKPHDRTDYSQGDAAALGNHIADCVIGYGLQDGANELEGYVNRRYYPRNAPLVTTESGIFGIDPNVWQPLSFSDGFVDQGGNAAGDTPDFLGAEWGSVTPFALESQKLVKHTRDNIPYFVYEDPGKPPYINHSGYQAASVEEETLYQWAFSLVSAWSAHLDPEDETLIDISPAAMGNLATNEFPQTLAEYQDFYDIYTGPQTGSGYNLNPHTQQPYESQWVKRGDYTRVLAEFWADGPDSETPPGHWFTVLNYVTDHPEFEPRFAGDELVDRLEWDVKAYFTLGGALHDAAISAWSIKGWYDYVRPISAIRYMARQGQSSDPNLPNYHPHGVPLIDGLIELVTEEDDILYADSSNLHQIKLYAWRGHDYAYPYAGVDWIMAADWMPYQKTSFVTPPFAGYVSGHSTFSRAAAEVITLLTGDPFFPGGMGEFFAPQNDFLVFEEGPSQDITLQWATYRDAADQTALSRIWGGIHPPVDDIPGRLIGERVGKRAFKHALQYFNGRVPR